MFYLGIPFEFKKCHRGSWSGFGSKLSNLKYKGPQVLLTFSFAEGSCGTQIWNAGIMLPESRTLEHHRTNSGNGKVCQNMTNIM